jgi:hypothetical protein
MRQGRQAGKITSRLTAYRIPQSTAEYLLRGDATPPSLALALPGAHAGLLCWARDAAPGKAEPSHMDIPTGAAKSHESHPHRCFRPVWCQT